MDIPIPKPFIYPQILVIPLVLKLKKSGIIIAGLVQEMMIAIPGLFIWQQLLITH